MRKLKKGKHKSQNRGISPPCSGATCAPISTEIDILVGLANVITYAKIGLKMFNGFPRATGEKTRVLICHVSIACRITIEIHHIVFTWCRLVVSLSGLALIELAIV
jgi:hypothetical protein